MASSYIENPVLNKQARAEIASEIYRLFGILGGKCVITFDHHAIQVIVFPRFGEQFLIPGDPPFTGTIRNNQLYQE
jgi:hypothetical protein